MRSGYHVMTASDDTHVRLFDLATATTLMKLKAHKVNIFKKNSTFKRNKINEIITRIIYDQVA